MKGADVDGVGVVQHQQRQQRCQRFVQVQHIKAFPRQQPAHPRVQPPGEGNARGRTAGSQRHGAPHRYEIVIGCNAGWR